MKKILVYILTITILMSISVPVFAEDDRGEFYPLLTVVFETEDEEDCRIVKCRDKSQNVWEFYDEAFEWEQGDIANLLMWRMGNNYIEDEIIEVYWEGYTENLDLFFEMDGWR